MILVFGKNGQLATALAQVLHEATFLSSAEANFHKTESILQILNQFKPTIVINASAYTAVDKAETERDQALQVNAIVPGIIAKWCKEHNACLIHYSTDYVFSGDGVEPWLEDSPTQAVNWYGETKLRGEQEILKSECQSYIFRISWVYSPWGNNFKKTILRLAREREELTIVNDQWGAPTDARHVAQTTAEVVRSLLVTDQRVKQSPPFGIYHLRYEPYQTWYDFATRIVEEAKAQGENLKVKKISPVSSEQFPTPAKRPKNSRLGSKFNFFNQTRGEI